MKLERLFSALWAWLLSFAVSAAATMCVVTAFRLGIDTGLLLRTCALTALICSVCYSLPLSLVPLGGGAAILGYLWQIGTLEASFEAFLNRLSRQYDRAYGWGIIRWGFRTADEMEPDIVFVLCVLGAVVAMLCAWSVCRRRTVIPALFAAFLTVCVCFVVNDTVPDIPWLYLLLLGFIVLMMSGSVRKQDEKQGNRLCLLLTPAVALALLILFAAIPREQYKGQDTAKRMADAVLHSDSMQLLLGHIDDGSAISSTDTNAVDLKSVGYRMESHAQVLQVTAPYTGTLYLRGRAMDTYDGTSWSDSGLSYTQLPWPWEGLTSVGEVTVSTRFAHRMLYTPYYTDALQISEVSVGVENDKKLTEYSFNCKQLEDPALLTKYYPTADTRADPWQLGLVETFIEKLPQSDAVVRWSRSLAQRITNSCVSPYHKAQAIASYVRNSASYDTRTARMPATEKDFAQWFLEDSSTGYCVHFATAATVLLRAAGIPARYVTGYYAQVTEGEQVTVYSDQAHAWAEYWLPGFGWTVLEATPPDFSAETEETTENTVSTTGPTVTEGTVPDTDVTAPTDALVPEPQKNRDWVLWVLLSIVAVCAVVTTAEVQRRLRQSLRRRRLETALPNEKALLYWREVTVYARLLNETPDEVLFLLAQRAKFSQHTVTPAQLQQFEAYLDTAVSRLKRHNLFRRLYYRILLAVY